MNNENKEGIVGKPSKDSDHRTGSRGSFMDTDHMDHINPAKRTEQASDR
jgi:hypothetical protein